MVNCSIECIFYWFYIFEKQGGRGMACLKNVALNLKVFGGNVNVLEGTVSFGDPNRRFFNGKN